MDEIKSIIEQFIDYLAPELTPYESSIYLYLLRHSLIAHNSFNVRIGKRTIASGFGKGSRGKETNFAHVTEVLKHLQEKHCIEIGDINREGTFYTIRLPMDIPFVAKRIANIKDENMEDDYFNNPDKRKLIFKRDNWRCQYCGERVNRRNATIDHYVPQSRKGTNNKDNLKTCCLICNSIKSGKTYEEAVPFLLKNIKERKTRSMK